MTPVWIMAGVVLTVLAIAFAWPRVRLGLIRAHGAPAALREFAAATLAQGGTWKMLGYHALLPVVDRRLPRPIVTWLCRKVGAQQGIDFSELAEPLESHATLGAFFTRGVQPARRPVCAEAGAVISPVDGDVESVGRIDEAMILEAKGAPYRLEELLPLAGTSHFHGGDFVVLYLRPADCHRVFSPLDQARVEAAVAVPGGEMPVAPAVRGLVSGIYVHNRRLAHLLATPAGRVALVMVGAYKVGRLVPAYDPRPWNAFTARSGLPERRDYAPAPVLARAEWLATFHLGSTVILLFEPGRVRLEPGLAGRRLRYGERLGRFGPPA